MFGPLPNISGSLNGGSDPQGQFLCDVVSPSGAFKVRNVGTKYGIATEAGPNFGCQYLDFKASDSDSSYSGTKLQSPSLQLLPCIRC